MLLKGQSPRQVGSTLNLSQSQIDELAMDLSDVDPQPELETHADWEKRKREELAKKFVGIAETQADYLAETGVALDPDSMGTLVDASAIAHKWLKAGEEGVKTQTINFRFLAEAKPPTIRTGEIIDVPPSEEG